MVCPCALIVSESTESWAAFGQVSWRPSALDHKLELTGGLRYTKDDKKAVQLIPIARTGRLSPTISRSSPRSIINGPTTS